MKIMTPVTYLYDILSKKIHHLEENTSHSQLRMISNQKDQKQSYFKP